MTEHREQGLAWAFIALTETLVEDFDLAVLLSDLTQACVDLLGVAAAGMMVVDDSGRLRSMTFSDERAPLRELMELQSSEGPSLDCRRTGAMVRVTDLAGEGPARWPRFTAMAVQAEFSAVYALPMRLRGDNLGALNLFDAGTRPASGQTLRIGQALADLATICILQHRAIEHPGEISAKMQLVLNNRYLIEQAKGVLAERAQIEPDAAFAIMRAHARSTNQRLAELARGVVNGEVDTAPLLADLAPGSASPGIGDGATGLA